MNVAIIGCGTMGQMHAEMAQNCGAEIAVFCDAEGSRARGCARAYNADALDNPGEVMKRDDVDLVVIATPTPDHVRLIKAAAKAGKHIFCEKPMCRTVKQCQEALSATERAGVKLFVGHVVRYFQEFEAIRAQIKAGKIGEPGFVKTFRGGVFPGGPNGWFRDYRKSGGAVLDMLIHDLDWVRYMFGEVQRVFCQNLQKKKPVAMDYALVTMRMQSGVIAHCIGSWAHPEGFRVKAEVCGTKGMVQFDSAGVSVATMQRDVKKGGPKTIVPGSPVEVSPYQLEWEDCIAWAADDRAPRVTPDDALQAVRIAEAAITSAKEGAPVAL